MHHKVFDLGAFAINPELVILVSEKANGSQGLQETLLQFHRKPLRKPQRPDFDPLWEFTDWHQREVFKGNPRHTEFIAD